eukprot:m.49943 g.49943  ORF g.49943 m.49943 type:complete len:474 (+) comp12113_c0_seq1:305-1726(+)
MYHTRVCCCAYASEYELPTTMCINTRRRFRPQTRARNQKQPQAHVASVLANKQCQAPSLAHLNTNPVPTTQVSNDHVQQAIEAGTVCFKAQGNDDVVLCTADRTYMVKMADTSNALLLLPPYPGQAPDVFATRETPCPDGCPPGQPRLVAGSAGAFLEVSQCPPKLDKLRALLTEHVYTGEDVAGEDDDENEEVHVTGQGVGANVAANVDVDGDGDVTMTPTEQPKVLKGLSFEQLQTLVQASDAELRQGLRRFNACCLEGRYMSLCPQYATRAFGLVLDTVAAEGWDLDKVDLKATAEALRGHGIRPEVVECLLRQHSDHTQDAGEGTPSVFCLEPRLVAQFRACELLETGGQEWGFEAFMQTWAASLQTDGVDPDEDWLRGVAIVSEATMAAPLVSAAPSRTLRYLPKSSLSGDPKKRFAELFALQPVWPKEVMVPYVEDVVPPGLTVDKILFKYTKAFKDEAGNAMHQKR